MLILLLRLTRLVLLYYHCVINFKATGLYLWGNHDYLAYLDLMTMGPPSKTFSKKIIINFSLEYSDFICFLRTFFSDYRA